MEVDEGPVERTAPRQEEREEEAPAEAPPNPASPLADADVLRVVRGFVIGRDLASVKIRDVCEHVEAQLGQAPSKAAVKAAVTSALDDLSSSSSSDDDDQDEEDGERAQPPSRARKHARRRPARRRASSGGGSSSSSSGGDQLDAAVMALEAGPRLAHDLARHARVAKLARELGLGRQDAQAVAEVDVAAADGVLSRAAEALRGPQDSSVRAPLLRLLGAKFLEAVPLQVSGAQELLASVEGLARCVELLRLLRDLQEADALALRCGNEPDAMWRELAAWADLAPRDPAELALEAGWKAATELTLAAAFDLRAQPEAFRAWQAVEGDRPVLFAACPPHSVVRVLRLGFLPRDPLGPPMSMGLRFHRTVSAARRHLLRRSRVLAADQDVYVFACRVACGKVKHMPKPDRWYERPPEGHHSLVLGERQPQADGQADGQAEQEEDETAVVVFDASQVQPLALALVRDAE